MNVDFDENFFFDESGFDELVLYRVCGHHDANATGSQSTRGGTSMQHVLGCRQPPILLAKWAGGGLLRRKRSCGSPPRQKPAPNQSPNSRVPGQHSMAPSVDDHHGVQQCESVLCWKQEEVGGAMAQLHPLPKWWVNTGSSAVWCEPPHLVRNRVSLILM